MTIEDRKQRLILACEADRVAWCNACRPAPRPPVQLAAQLFSFLEPVASLIPGWPGRWLRNASFFARIGRQFGLIPS
jgi:hypothetical protein